MKPLRRRFLCVSEALWNELGRTAETAGSTTHDALELERKHVPQ